ncbi:MAG TPA: tripartite tricarboxylate transporter substrate-binding protein, partial [Beijerinckiaceae bacterium]|nr:tripartite tricarboxylate transporter substrate-binding protein [Beijerinckiaceae bacterium]
GKQITLLVGGGPGGGYDVYARTFAPFYGNHIPGNPRITVENMVGASGLRVANYIANAAAKDGTVIAISLSSVPTAPLLSPEGVNFDVRKMSWIGSITKDSFVGYVWHTSQIQTLDDLKTKEVVMGADAVGAEGADMAILAKELFGLKIKLVLGYPDSMSVKLAMEKGEVEGTFANSWVDLKTGKADWLRDHQIRVIVQHGLERHRDLPDVPLLIDLAKTPDDRAAVELLAVRQEYNKPFFAPPGLQPERLAILRRAFDAAVGDPAFLQAADKAKLDIYEPMRGEDLAAKVAEVAKTAPIVVQRITQMFAKYK